MQAKSVNQDLVTGMFIGGGLAAIMHYVNMVLLAWKARRAADEVAKMIAEHVLGEGKK